MGNDALTLNRRSFLKWSGAVTGTSALVGAGLTFNASTQPQAQAAGEGMADADKTVWSACTVNCGSRCPVPPDR